MVIGSMRLTLHLPENHSLKGKRQVVQSLVARLRRTFNVAVAEVEDQDAWQVAVLGVACVSNDARHADAMLATIAAWVEADAGGGEALLARHQIELIQA
ncbi:MAG TPA: DUF503 domain-containing protein [Candidatus Micrarchaeia archaeon]|nr:DUF503 domain-containing protein [Candidatus Micrarchaeia archaeon]